MKRILLTVLFSLFCFSAHADPLQLDPGSNARIQGAAYNGAKAQLLSVGSTTIDMTNSIAYAVYCSADCYERWMPLSSSTKANYVKTIIPANAWHSGVVNRPVVNGSGTPFGNFSVPTGATAYLKRM